MIQWIRRLVYDKRVDTYMDDTVDNTFGIRHESGKFKIGGKVIKIQDDNIEIDEEMYMTTPGFWEIFTERNPQESSSKNRD